MLCFVSDICSGTGKCTEEDLYKMDKPTFGKGKTGCLDIEIQGHSRKQTTFIYFKIVTICHQRRLLCVWRDL